MSVFSDIYTQHRWGGTSRSGPGSDPEATALISRRLKALVEGVQARSVLDAGCGEARWMPELPGYIGVDIVSPLINQNARWWPERGWLDVDICTARLPEVDLVLCRDVLMHLPLRDGAAALENFRRTHATWLVASSFDGGTNVDIPAGQHFPIDMRVEPFNLGRPWAVIEDDWRDERKYLGVWAALG